MKTNLISRLSLLSLVVYFIVSSCTKEQTDNKQETPKANSEINFSPAKTSAELLALRADKNANLIRSLDDFNNILLSKATPLSELTLEQLSEFKSSIVVREGVGVVGFNYEMLEKNLTYDDFATVLALFGLDAKQGFWGFSKDLDIINKLSINQKSNADYDEEIEEDGGEGDLGDGRGADHPGYACSLIINHTCKKKAGYICLAGC